MAIEVRELVIRATIPQENAPATPQPPPGMHSGNTPASNEQVINTCVEKVLEILKARNQR